MNSEHHYIATGANVCSRHLEWCRLGLVELILEWNPETLPSFALDLGGPLVLGLLGESARAEMGYGGCKVHHLAGLVDVDHLN